MSAKISGHFLVFFLLLCAVLLKYILRNCRSRGTSRDSNHNIVNVEVGDLQGLSVGTPQQSSGGVCTLNRGSSSQSKPSLGGVGTSIILAEEEERVGIPLKGGFHELGYRPATALPANGTSVHKLLPKSDLLRGLLPQAMKSFSFSETDNRFFVLLEQPCNEQFEHLVYHDVNITGTLCYGSITDLKGIYR
ncbi:hypothetical protein EJ110_NYTH55389 [Nymphaea thermarum]|nr:hypothetical protein EJ110_NYTH55389 [Nymphaea thermarum]